MSRGLARFRLDPELASEADFLLPSHGHVEKRRELVEFVLHVGIPERGVPFASAPEYITAATEFLGYGDRFFDLGRSVGEDRQAWRGGSTLGETRMRKQAGRAP